MLSNLKITLNFLVVRASALFHRAEALTTNLELFTPTYLIKLSMLSNLKITLDFLVVRASALFYRAEALTTNLELFIPTYLSINCSIFGNDFSIFGVVAFLAMV